MFPLDLYRTVVADRLAGRRPRLRSASGRRHGPPPARPATRPLTVTGPHGRVVLTGEGVTRIDREHDREPRCA